MLRPSLILLALVLAEPLAALAQPTGGAPADDRTIPIHGVDSPDEENERKEPDTRFGRPLRRPGPEGATGSGATAGVGKGTGRGGSAQTIPLKDHEDSASIVEQLVAELREMEVDVQLLGGHKYMVNDCLGIKVSAGGFEMSLADTKAWFEGSSLVIETGIEHISISVVKLRMRPNPNVLELCSFSDKFEVGGDLDDVEVRFTFDPILNAEKNRLVGIGQPQVRVRIGNLNLKPLQNNLDAMAKNMVEDGLTVFLSTNFVDAVNAIFMRILDPGNMVTGGREIVEGNRGGGGSGSGSADLERRIEELERRVEELERQLAGEGGGTGVEGATGSPATAGGGAGRGLIGRLERRPGTADSRSYEIVDAPDLKGRLGRLVLAFPEGTTELKVTTRVHKAGDEKPLRTDYGPFAIELTPGSYDIDLGGRKISGVPIESKRDTKLRAGVLRLNASGNTTFRLFEPGADTAFGTWYGTTELGLPPGPVEVEVNGQRETVTVRAGEIVEY